MSKRDAITAHKNEILRRKTEKYIRENLSHASVEELAVLLGFSRVYTGRLVKKLTDSSFKTLLQEARLKAAAREIRSTNKKIGEIILECGYENESFFRRIFKKEFGETPLEYRKKHK